MNQKSYQAPIVRVVAHRAAAIVCASPGLHTYNSVGSGTQYSAAPVAGTTKKSN